MKGDIGHPDLEYTGRDQRDLHRALMDATEREQQAVYERARFAQRAQERLGTADEQPFVGDDDHAPPWIDRGGRDTREYNDPPGAFDPQREIDAVTAPRNPKDAQALRDGKVPLDLIEHAAEMEIARAMHTGAVKYGRRNYCHPDTPIFATTYAAAVRRHMGAWLAGEDLDPDSGLSHWAHIGANVNVVLGAIAAGTFIDDRAPAEPLAASARSNAQHSSSVSIGTPIRSGD